MKTIFFLSIWLLALHTSGQVPLAKHINKQSGLPTNTVYNILQDSQDYIWLGTDKGLFRYDGKQFRAYYNNQLNSPISDLRIDKNGKLRCQNFSGQHFYLINDSLCIDTELIVTGNFSPVVEDGNGQVHFLRFNASYKFKPKGFTRFFKKEVYTLFSYKQNVYTFDSTHIYSLTGKRDSIKIPFSLQGETVFFTCSIKGKLYVFPRNLNNKIAYSFFPQINIVSINIPAALIQSIKVIKDSLLFLATSNGLYVLNNNFQPLKIEQPLLPQKNVSSVMQDAEGAIWVSTLDNGIFKFDCFNCLNFKTREPIKILSPILAQNTVLCGTPSGKVYEWNNNQLVKIDTGKNRQPITALFRTTQNTLLIGGDVFTIKETNKPPITTSMAVKKIISLPNDELVLARTGGISILSPKKNSLSKLSGTIRFSSSNWVISDWHDINNGIVRVTNIVYDSTNNQIYAVSSIGLLVVTKEKWFTLKYQTSELMPIDIAIRNDTIFIIENKRLIGIKNNRILFEKPIEIAAPTKLQLNKQSILISSGNKLYEYDNSFKIKKVIGVTNNSEINDICLTNTQLLIGTDEGLILTDLNQTIQNLKPLHFYIDQFIINNNQVDYRKTQILGYQENNIKLVFSIPFYGNQEDLTVAYQLNNGDWQTMEKGLRELNLISLEPGKYNIQFKASTIQGAVSAINQISFVIRPPFWKTWWFYLLSLLIVAVLVYIIYHNRFKLIQKRNELEKQTIVLENKLRESTLASVKSQMNPHFIFNALNTIQSFIYLNDKKQATEYLGKFSQLTRKILELSNSNTVSLEEEIQTVLLYLDLEKMRFDESFNFTIITAHEIDPKSIHIPSMIIQPYLENAIKHGLLHKKGERWVKLSIEKQNQFLKVAIEDNGIGRQQSAALNTIKNKQHQSFATQANEKRLNALNGGKSDTVNVQYIDKAGVDGKPEGTIVELTIAILDS